MRIRSHLLLLAAGAMLPVLAFAVLVSVILVRQDSATVQRGALDAVRAMMTGVDAVLAGTVTSIKALAASSALAADDLDAFHEEASRVLGTQATWTTVTLILPSGEKVIDVSRPFGSTLPPVRDRQSVADAVATMQPVIGPVSAAGGSEPGVPVRVPVIRDGKVAYVLTAVVRPDSFEALITRQRLPDGWISGIVDRAGRFVARVPARPAGDLASVPFRAALLQALNILENTDVKGMEYNSPKYIHALYQTMNLAFADRDFYYGDPAFPPEEPVKGLLSKDYAKARFAQIDWTKNDPNAKPGDPYPFQGGTNPFTSILENWKNSDFVLPDSQPASGGQDRRVVPRTDSATIEADSVFMESFFAGTTSIEAADEEGWVVSVTPSGGWVPAVIAGRTGIGLSQRAQSFVTEAKDGPFNVIEPGKRPRVTLTPTLALKDGAPYLAFAVQGGDSQDQNLLQFFLNVVEFGMTVQQAVEAPNVNSYQMRSSFGRHESRPGRMTVASSLPESTREALKQMGYTLDFVERSSGPINAILFDWKHRTMWGGSSNHGEDYGIAW